MNQKYHRSSISSAFLGFCLLLLGLSLQSAQAATLASIGATIKELKTYESPKEGTALGQRVYSRNFLQESSRYIWWELNLTCQASGQETDIPLVVRYFKPDGSLFYEYNVTRKIQSDWTEVWFAGGVGYEEPGKWAQGKYSIKIFEGDAEVAACNFSILTDREAAELILDWLELEYPDYISPRWQTTEEFNGAIYRTYTTTGAFCGTYADHLYFVDASYKAWDLGEVALWLSLVKDISDSGASITFNSANGGTVTTLGLAQVTVLPGAISANADGSSGQVLFSIEAGIPQEEWPAPLPDGYDAVSPIYLFGPGGFVFSFPVQIYLPAGDIESPYGLVVLWHNAAQSQWVPLPLADLDAVNHRLGVTVFELGYFLIARSPLISMDSGYRYAAYGDVMSDRRVGGARLIHNSYSSSSIPRGYYYTISIAAVAYKYPEIGWPNLVGYNVGTGSEPTGGPLELTRMMNIPQGTYTFVISRQKPGTISQLPGPVETYSTPVTVQVGPFTSAFGWGADAFTGWTDLTPLPEGTWQVGPPTLWPGATVPYGTGNLHITLEWENSSASSTDLDLHLYGPNGLHVYYSTDQSPDGSIQLDRDWQEEVGHAVENIFSVASVPSGEYTVKVHHFWGSVPKFFTVRVKLPDGTVTTYSFTMMQDDQEVTVLTFKVAAGGGGTAAQGNVVHYVKASQSDLPVQKPLPGARVIFGTGFNVRISASTILEYQTIVADVTSDDQGRFTANLPTGNFDVFIWKAGYTPSTGNTATWNLVNVELHHSDQGAHNYLSFQQR